jgi:hypothetical protein
MRRQEARLPRRDLDRVEVVVRVRDRVVEEEIPAVIGQIAERVQSFLPVNDPSRSRREILLVDGEVRWAVGIPAEVDLPVVGREEGNAEAGLLVLGQLAHQTGRGIEEEDLVELGAARRRSHGDRAPIVRNVVPGHSIGKEGELIRPSFGRQPVELRGTRHRGSEEERLAVARRIPP